MVCARIGGAYFMTFNDVDLLLMNLLNLNPKDVESLTSSSVDGEMTISVTLTKPDMRVCPKCGCVRGVSKGFYSKNIKLSSDAFRNTSVIVKVPRFHCPDCNHSFSDDRNMTPSGNTISYEVIIRIMNLLKNPDITMARCAELTGVSETTVVRTFDKYCHAGRAVLPEAMCIDEVYTKRNDFKNYGNQYSKYSCLLYDFYNRTVVDVLPSRTRSHLISYFSSLPVNERQGVKFVVIDMYRNYNDLVEIYFKRAVICVDSFHVIEHLNNSLNKLRIRIMNTYNTDSQEYYLLKTWNNLLFDRTRNLDNKGRYNKKMKRVMNYRQIRETILDIDPVLRQAWELKELYMDFNSTCEYKKADEKLTEILQQFYKADISEYRPFCRTVLEWKPYIVNSFIRYKGRRLNNGVAESINARVKLLFYNTHGMRNNRRRRKRILYSINKDGFSIK